MTIGNSKKIAIFAPYYVHVGTEHVMLTLAKGFAEKGNEVHLLRAYKEWADYKCSDGVCLIDLKAGHIIDALPWYPSYRLWNILLTAELLPKLATYIRRERPDVLITGLLGVVGVFARELSMSKTKVIISIQGLPRPTRVRNFLWKHLYSRADAIVSPSTDIIKRLPEKVTSNTCINHVIYNPVLDEDTLEQTHEPVEHKWFGKNRLPVILGVGRLTRQKDFHTLIKAFALVRKTCPAKLVILGEGEQRKDIESLAQKLNVFEDLDMPGFVKNPHKYMANSGVFVLSSIWEGPGHVYIEALSAGVPVVSTDCPFGPREMLSNGKAGLLVPVGDEEAMAEAIVKILVDSNLAENFKKVGLERSQDFYPDNIVKKYLQLIDKLVTV